MKAAGFTLLEVLLYIALSSIVVSVGLRMGYSLIETGYALEEQALVAMETQFITYKVNDALQRAQGVFIPTEIGSSDAITLQDQNGQSLTIALQEQALFVSRNGTMEPLSSDATLIDQFLVTRYRENQLTVTHITLRINSSEYVFVKYD